MNGWAARVARPAGATVLHPPVRQDPQIVVAAPPVRARSGPRMKILFLGGTGIISSACTQLAVARGFDVTPLN